MKSFAYTSLCCLFFLCTIKIIKKCLVNWNNCNLQFFPYNETFVYNYSLAYEFRTLTLNKYTFFTQCNFNSIDPRCDVDKDEFIAFYDSIWPFIKRSISEPVLNLNMLENLLKGNMSTSRIIVSVANNSINSVTSSSMLVTDFLNLLNTKKFDWVYAGDEWFLNSSPLIKYSLSPLLELVSEDYFPLFPDALRPWGPMLLWGSTGSKSPLHIDPYNWTGLNFVLKGHKKWKFIRPGQDSYFKVTNQPCGYPLNCIKYNSPIDAFDSLEENLSSDILEIDQYASDLVIIPSGWLHQVMNVEETVAISTQVMNNANFRNILEEIIKGGSVRRDELPPDLHYKTPKEQIQTVLHALPDDVIQSAKDLNERILNNIRAAV